jgi:AmiR/NasT family two-component response regulator
MIMTPEPEELVAPRAAQAAAEVVVAQQQEIRELRQALESRSVIDQAKGLIRSWLCCDEDAAFRALTIASQHANVKLRALANELVALASDCSADADAWLLRHVGPPADAAQASTG